MAEAMTGRIVTNKKTGEKAWWDGKTLTPVKVDIDPNQPGAAQDQALIESGKPLSIQDITKLGQESAIQEPAFRSLARATIPTLGTLASFAIPGSGLAATLGQAALGGGATALNQALGMEPESNGSIALSAALPLVAKGVVSGVKGLTRAGAELAAPGPLREAGVEAANVRMGRPAEAITRATAIPASKAAYAATEGIGPVETKPLANIVAKAFQDQAKMANPDKAALKYLNNLGSKFGKNLSLDYAEIRDELNQLGAMAEAAGSGARPKNVLAQTLNKTRAAIIDQLDQVSPALREANAIYRREQAAKTVTSALRTSNPGVKLREILENDAFLTGAFDKRELKDIRDIADRISDVASGVPVGGFSRLMSAMAEPFADMMTNELGRGVMRSLMGPSGKATPATLATALQFWRAYRAQTPQ